MFSLGLFVCLFFFFFIADGELEVFRESLVIKAGKFVRKFMRLVIPEECKGTSAMIIFYKIIQIVRALIGHKTILHEHM